MPASGHRFVFAALLAAASLPLAASAQAVLPGYLTDSTAEPGAAGTDERYTPPEPFRYPYVSTYYVKPTVAAGEDVKVGFFVTDFASSLVRFLDDSHRFTAFLEYRPVGGEPTVLALEDLPSGDAAFDLGALPAGDYEMRLWAKDAQGRESHRVIHDFRVRDAKDLEIPADRVFAATAEDLAAYGVRGGGDLERVVFVAADGTETVVKEKRADAPGYVATLPLDPETGKEPWQAFKKIRLAYDEGYDRAAVEAAALANVEGLQRLLDDKAAAGFRKVVLPPGTYRLSHEKSLFVPDGMTLDLGGAVLKQNGFTGDRSCMVRLSGVTDSHLVNGTLEGDYWEHDYLRSRNNSEWPAGFEIGGDCRYCSVEDVTVADVAGYGGQNGISHDAPGGLSRFLEGLPVFAPGGLDPATGEVDAKDAFRFTTDFKDLSKIRAGGARRLQVSKYLGYQGLATRSWQTTVAWYDAQRRFLGAETCWQYREMWIPEDAAFLRVSVEAESAEAADQAGLSLTAFNYPVNCAVARCTFDRCRCVGYAASAMKNMLFEGNRFTRCGESAACCAFDAEDGWDQMQDVTFRGNVFRDNPRNNSILACAGHNFVLEGNEGDIHLWGRTHSPCVRGNAVGQGTFYCDSRLRSGYGRFDGNAYAKGVQLGTNEMKERPDDWDQVLSGVEWDGARGPFAVTVGAAGRLVGCTLRNLPVGVANARDCLFENCTDASAYLPFPGGRWVGVTVRDSALSRFHRSYRWERCRFENAKLDRMGGASLSAKDCVFEGCTLFGIGEARIRMSGCTLRGTSVQGNWWEKPADVVFRHCAIRTGGGDAPLRLGAYTVGRVVFDGCEVEGEGSLVDVKDLRPIQLPASVAPEDNPDRKPGTISLRGIRWTGAGSPVVAHAAPPPGADPPKRIAILDRGNDWPEGVALATDLPPSWQIR